MKGEKQPYAGALCGRNRKHGKGLCTQPAGWGTSHVGEGACKAHGGASDGAPEGNKNAVKTGEFEAIWLDQLEDDEKELVQQVQTDKLSQVNTEIALVEVRERRMLQRLKALKDGPEMVISEHKEGVSSEKGAHRETTTEHRDKRTQALEDALTRVQAYKAKLIQLKHEIEKAAKDAPNAQAGIDALVDALARSRKVMEGDTE